MSTSRSSMRPLDYLETAAPVTSPAEGGGGPSVGNGARHRNLPAAPRGGSGTAPGQLPQEVPALGPPGGEVGRDRERELQAGLRLLGLEAHEVALRELEHLAG